MLTNTNQTYLFAGFEFRTDASGNITAWAVGANDGPHSGFSWVANNWSLFGGVTTPSQNANPDKEEDASRVDWMPGEVEGRTDIDVKKTHPET